MDRFEQRVAEQLQRVHQKLSTNKPDLANDLHRLSFQVYLSDPAAVQAGGVYFCGLKPYGAENKTYAPPTPLPANFNTYRDAPTGSPFYPRARKLIRFALDHTLGPNAPLDAALCTNWYFQRAADTAQLKRFGLAALDSSEVHRSLLDITQPRLILCVGNGPISAYRGMLDLHGVTTRTEARYLGNSYLRAATTPGSHVIIGVPHLSRYGVEPALLDFIAEQLAR